jgi:LPXTG-motif cell wall-anchored protein
LALALIVAPAAAQTYTNEPQQLQTPPVQEERTNPDAPAITGDSGLTITGTVESVTDTALVLQTTAGTHTIQFDNRTSKPAVLNVGDRVAIDYTRTSTGVMIATAVRPEGAITETGVTTGTATSTGVSVSESEADVEAGAAEAEADLEADVSADSELPETGSELPLVGLIGLLALLAATGFRVARRNA